MTNRHQSIDRARKLQPIENEPNRYKLQVEHSPDLLFMRSTLHIMNADFYDFGLYNCTVSSAFPGPQDYLAITLRPSAPTGE